MRFHKTSNAIVTVWLPDKPFYDAAAFAAVISIHFPQHAYPPRVCEWWVCFVNIWCHSCLPSLSNVAQGSEGITSYLDPPM